MSTVSTATGVRRLVTELPGPRSRELARRRLSAVARGVSSMLPPYIAASADGLLTDRGGRSGGPGVRPRLPRPYQPDHGIDRQGHALQAPLRPVRPRGVPGADVVPVP